MLIHSHRGIGYGQPENTVAAFRAALTAGHGIELDVRLALDKQIVIKHDRLMKGEVLPTFDEVGRLLHEFWPLQQDSIAIHLKEAEQSEPMIEILGKKMAEYGLWQSAFVFDVTRAAADFLLKQDKRFRLAISVGAERHTPTIFTVADLAAFTDIDIYWMDEWTTPYSVNNEESYRRFKNEGKRLYVISPDVAVQNNHPWARHGLYSRMWRHLFDWQADGICTDVPLELAEFQQKQIA